MVGSLGGRIEMFGSIQGEVLSIVHICISFCSISFIYLNILLPLISFCSLHLSEINWFLFGLNFNVILFFTHFYYELNNRRASSNCLSFLNSLLILASL